MTSKVKQVARRIGLPILRRVNPGDIRIRHHWTGHQFVLHSFKHKGYWFHGGNRERETMIMCARLLGPGDVVVEIGGHIGYLTDFFAEMVGPAGRVDVYEPSPENLTYLNRNVGQRTPVEIIKFAVSDKSGPVDFFVEDLTGQNSSLLRDYQALKSNERAAGVSAQISRITVQARTLDNLYASTDRLDFVKIDVEGAERLVLEGARQALTRLRPIILIEVSQDHEMVANLLSELGYTLITPKGALEVSMSGNRNHFAFHREAHADVIVSLGLDEVDSEAPAEGVGLR